MTLVEFLAPLKRATHRDRCLAALYYNERYLDIAEMSVEQVRSALVQARVPNAKAVNVADALSKSGHFVDAPGSDAKGRKLWRLTEPGRHHVRTLLDLPADQPEIEQDVSSLRALADRLSDPMVQGFVAEAVTCLSVGALRATIVFLWSGAIRTLQGKALATYTAKDVNNAIQKHDPKARAVTRVDDFAAVKDKVTLLAIRELGLIDKGQWTSLQAALDLRNHCGHPTKYMPGPKKASSFVEDVINIAF
jgi:hypothetical protein